MSRGQSGGDADRATPIVRLAALIALLAPVAMVAVAATALAGSLARALGAVALVLLAVAAGWVGLTSRGARRAAGAVLAVLAGAALLVLVATNLKGVAVVIVLALLLALYGAAGRYALGRGVARPPSPGAPALAVAPARGGVLIMNLRSGGGKAERFDLAGEARRRGIEPVILTPGDDLLELAEDAVRRGADVIGMAGGDGSQALVATVAARTGVAHVCIPAGTRNHFALDLGLDRDDVVGALDAFSDGLERRIDLARVNDRVFVNNASLGVYAKVVQSDAYRDAKLETWTRMLPDLLGPGAEPIDLDVPMPDGSHRRDAAIVLVSNNPYQLTHLAGAGTRGRLDAGVLGVFVAGVQNPGEVSRLVALELAGQAARYPGLTSWTTQELEIGSSAPVEVGLDGEALVLEPPLRFSSMPGALRVRVPRSAGLAPAARAVALTRENLRLLVSEATGR